MNKEVAETHKLSVRTIETYQAGILRTIGVKNDFREAVRIVQVITTALTKR